MRGLVEIGHVSAGCIALVAALLLSACSNNSNHDGVQAPPAAAVDATLSGLALAIAGLDQAFQPNQTDYTATVGFLASSTSVTPTTAEAGATITVNGVAVASGAESAAIALNEGLNTITVEISAAGRTTSTYTIDVTRESANDFAERTALTASNAESQDEFGGAVALSGDLLAVGAIGEDAGAGAGEADNGTSRSGAVYVFLRSAGVWSQEAYLKASNADVDDEFGYCLALSGDTLVVGAWGEDSAAAAGEADNSADGAGAAYVFVRNAGVWSQQALLKASNADATDGFGSSVDIDGDTIVVGAAFEDGNGTSEADNSANVAGAAYVFERAGGNWSQTGYLKASNARANALFGYAAAVSGDTVVVGAAYEDSDPAIGPNDTSLPNSGAAYVFVRGAGVWSEQAMLKASDPQSYDGFGFAVDVSRDTVAVGAPRTSGNAAAYVAGKAYVFVRNAGIWSQQARLVASNADDFDYFGWAVALAGDVLAVSASGEDSDTQLGGADNSASYSGAAYLFLRDGVNWTETKFLKPTTADAGAEFGRSVAVDGDTIIVGEDYSGVAVANAGAAYEFH